MARNYNTALGVAGITLLGTFVTGCSMSLSPQAGLPPKPEVPHCETVPTVTILLDRAAENDFKANRASQASLETFLGSSAVPTEIRIDPSTQTAEGQDLLNFQVASTLAVDFHLAEGKVVLTDHGVAGVPTNEISIHAFAEQCYGGSAGSVKD